MGALKSLKERTMVTIILPYDFFLGGISLFGAAQERSVKDKVISRVAFLFGLNEAEQGLFTCGIEYFSRGGKLDLRQANSVMKMAFCDRYVSAENGFDLNLEDGLKITFRYERKGDITTWTATVVHGETGTVTFEN